MSADIHPAPVVVGIDGSPESIAAARYAIAEAQRRRCDMTLLYAMALPPTYTAFMADAGNFLDTGAEVLADALAELTVPHGMTVHTTSEPTTAPAALAYASRNASLIVLGRRRAGWGERMLTGSVSSAVSARAHAPVITVPRGWTPQQLTGSSAIVVALDAVPAGHAALQFAFLQAELCDCDLIVLHAHPADGAGTIGHSEHAAITAHAVGLLQRAHPRVRVRQVVVPRDARHALTDYSVLARMLVVARPRAQAVFGTWVTSVARSVLKRSHCPVAVVPPVRTSSAALPMDPSRQAATTG